MIQTVPRWKVVIELTNGAITIFINDNHLSNVMRQLAVMSFENEPKSITIRVDEPSGT